MNCCRSDRWLRGVAAGLCCGLAVAALGACARPPATFSGIWKSNCGDYWGLLISPLDRGYYSVTFCGLSGCLGHEEWTPDTRIEGDPLYQVISPAEIRIQRRDGGYFSYLRCSAETEWKTTP